MRTTYAGADARLFPTISDAMDWASKHVHGFPHMRIALHGDTGMYAIELTQHPHHGRVWVERDHPKMGRGL